MTKVTKVYLISEQIDKDGNKIDFKKISELLWNLQMQTRDIKNKCVQLCWEWLNFSSDYYKKSEEYPKEKPLLNCPSTNSCGIDVRLGSFSSFAQIRSSEKFAPYSSACMNDSI